MSHLKDNPSDDEFHDAVSDLSANEQATVTSTREEVERIVEQQKELSLNDEDDANGKETNAGGDNAPDVPITDGELNDDELRLREANRTVEDLEEDKENANKLKIEGNEAFKNEENERAIELYTEALNICPLKNTKERAILFGNRAAVKSTIGSIKPAIEDCRKAIELWPEYVRVILRRAKLNEKEDLLDEALKDYTKVYELDPGQKDAREAMVRLPPLINERNERLKAEMMSGLKDLGNMILKPFGLSTANFKMQQDPNTGSYSINFNQGST